MSIDLKSGILSNIGANIGIPTDLARPNLYEVDISIPDSLNLASTIEVYSSGLTVVEPKSTIKNLLDFANKQFMQLNCKTVSMPGVNFGTVDTKEKGIVVSMPNDIIQDEFSMTFYLNNVHLERKFFIEWATTIIDADTGFVGYYDDYISTILVTQLDRQYNPTSKVAMYECYPKSISSVEYSYDSADSVAEFTVVFGYKNWKSVDISVGDTTESLVFKKITKKPLYL